MSNGRFAWIAVLVGAFSPGLAHATPQGFDDAALNEAMLQYREPSRMEVFAWLNPFMPEASADQPAAVDETVVAFTTSDEDSADLRMAAIVADYDRGMLDRGGWENPYLPSGSAGSPILAVTVGAGVTQLSASGEEGAASGEPEEEEEPAPK